LGLADFFFINTNILEVNLENNTVDISSQPVDKINSSLISTKSLTQAIENSNILISEDSKDIILKSEIYDSTTKLIQTTGESLSSIDSENLNKNEIGDTDLSSSLSLVLSDIYSDNLETPTDSSTETSTNDISVPTITRKTNAKTSTKWDSSY
jgi:hypothetical protein